MMKIAPSTQGSAKQEFHKEHLAGKLCHSMSRKGCGISNDNLMDE